MKEFLEAMDKEESSEKEDGNTIDTIKLSTLIDSGKIPETKDWIEAYIFNFFYFF